MARCLKASQCFHRGTLGYPEDKTGSNGWKLKTLQFWFSNKDEFFPKVSVTEWNFAMPGTGTLVNK